MTAGVARRVDRCRSCGDDRLALALDLGSTPVANALLDGTDLGRQASYPLGIQLCEACGLVQVTHDLPAGEIFDGAYPYFSAYSESTLRLARAHAERLVAMRRLGPGSLVVEVGSNDGYLLRHLVPLGVRVLGIDPSPGPVEAAAAVGVPSVQAFLDVSVAEATVSDHGLADVVIANNVLAHVPDINGFVRGIKAMLGADSIVTIENPWIKETVKRLAFDTIYHEHYSYLSTSAVTLLFQRHGLHLNHVDVLDGVHGGSLRWWLSRHPGQSHAASSALRIERELGVDRSAFYADFSTRVRAAQRQLVEMLSALRCDGQRIAAYGAAAKGATLLNTTGIDVSTVEFVVDRNPAKWGKRIPGCCVPILPPEALIERTPNYALLLAWNMADEIVRQQAAFQDAGGRFIIPIGRNRAGPEMLEPSAA